MKRTMSKDIVWHKYPEWHKYPDELPSKKGKCWVSEGEEDLNVYLTTYTPGCGFDLGAHICIGAWAELDEDYGVNDEQI